MPPVFAMTLVSASSLMSGTLALRKGSVNRCPLSQSAPKLAMAKDSEIGARILQAVRRAGLTQAELARRVKVRESTVSNWISGHHGITWSNARAVGRALKISPGWIMFGADQEAERMAQTPEELAFLRLFREADDAGQASTLKYLTVFPTDRRKVG
jgi:transcriptional regulator with XRE-family HTH domain